MTTWANMDLRSVNDARRADITAPTLMRVNLKLLDGTAELVGITPVLAIDFDSDEVLVVISTKDIYRA